ncbi:MAG: integrase arm-type DNA-binding domain-containing protein [Caulobacter sp.]|nr:integrase arm-type DNA-binding domain-containing protein [Caulobacter sp.]
MPTNKLSDAAIRTTKASNRPVKVSDGGGLFLLVQPNGSRLWRLAYRFAGKQKSLSFGPYPSVSLSEVRALRDEAQRALRNGIDPSDLRRLAKAPLLDQQKPALQSVAERWFKARSPAWSAGYATRVWGRVEDDLLAVLGDVPVDQIGEQQLLEALRKVESRGAVESAHRLRQMAEDIFKFAKAEGLLKLNPAIDIAHALAKPRPTKRRTAVLASDLPDFLKSVSSYHGDEITQTALRFVLLTFVRTGEVRGARWREFEGLDGDQPLWRIPAERMKMRQEHIVPLAPQAVLLLKQLDRPSDPDALVFVPRGGRKPLSENTLIYAVYRMGWHSRATVHGIRGTASTILNEHGFNRDWIERQLAHSERDGVRAAYNSAEWLSGRRTMMEWWANYLQMAEASGGVDELAHAD